MAKLIRQLDRHPGAILDPIGGGTDVAKSKSTSKKAASTASKVLRDKRYSDAAKTAAGSALSQKKPTRK